MNNYSHLDKHLIQLPRVEGPAVHQYTVAVRLTPIQGVSTELQHQQSARTSRSSSDHSLSAEVDLVHWNEIFFFKVETPVGSIDLFIQHVCIFLCTTLHFPLVVMTIILCIHNYADGNFSYLKFFFFTPFVRVFEELIVTNAYSIGLFIFIYNPFLGELVLFINYITSS